MRSHTVPSNNRATIKASRNAPIFFRRERDARLLCLLRTVRKPFRVILCTPRRYFSCSKERLACKARVLLTFRTPLASSNRLRHFFNAQATNNNNNKRRRSARSFETEVTEENLASRASKSRESSRPKNEDDDVKKEKRKTTSKRRSSSRRSTFTTARSRAHYHPRGGVVLSRFFGFGFSRRARVRAFSSRLLFSRRMVQKKEL